MKIVWTVLGVFGLGVVALGVHIFIVTRPHPDRHSRGMARIDLHQKIGRSDADRITAWLSRQRGVDHVFVNPGTAIAVFTYAPTTGNPAMIIKAFGDSLPYSKARRYLPATAEMRRGCPLKAMPVTNGLYQFLKRLF